MNVVAPRRFRHAGELTARASKDPRSEQFDEKKVVIDLRKCEFVRPAAVLWCAAYPLLSKRAGASCRLLVPDAMGVCSYLKAVGLFELLKGEGVDIDDRGIRRGGGSSQTVLSLRRFDTEGDVDDLANDAFEQLDQSRLASANLTPLVTEVFTELALNAAQHSDSPVGGFGFIQFYKFSDRKRFVCAVADGGIGIRESLAGNPALEGRFHYDWDAIELAVRERVSGTGEATRGIGLFGVAEDMRNPGHQFIIHSGQGSLEISEDVQSQARRVTLFPGTLVYSGIPA